MSKTNTERMIAIVRSELTRAVEAGDAEATHRFLICLYNLLKDRSTELENENALLRQRIRYLSKRKVG